MSTSADIPPFLYPIVQGIVDALRIPLAYILVNVAFTALLIPMLIALFYFASNRTSPVFICAVVTIFFGMLQGTTIAGTTIRDILNPLTPIPTGVELLNGLVVGLSILSIDVLLMCRVFAVVPPSRSSPRMLVAVYTFPIVSKLARVAILAVYFVRYMQDVRLHPTIGAQSFDTTNKQVQLYESIWIITALDNAYASGIFLWKLKATAFGRKDIGRVSDGSRDSFSSRIRTLFWLCGTNFIFPVPFYVAQLVLLKVNPTSPAYVILTFVNNYVATICAVFATVWSTGISRSRVDTHDREKASSLRFQGYAPRSSDPTSSDPIDSNVAQIELVPNGKESTSMSSRTDTSAKQLDTFQIHAAWARENDV